jgi:hypothetical protein
LLEEYLETIIEDVADIMNTLVGTVGKCIIFRNVPIYGR